MGSRANDNVDKDGFGACHDDIPNAILVLPSHFGVPSAIQSSCQLPP